MALVKRRRITPINNNFIDNLSDDLLINILDRLPCKSAVQCKSVSKRWCALISDPYFISRSIHRHHNLSDSFTLLIQHKKLLAGCFFNVLETTSSNPVFKSCELGLDFIPFHPLKPIPFRVVASFNDLLLVWWNSAFFICNSLTMQWLELPPGPSCHKETTVDLAGLVCEPFYCNKEKGFTINAGYRYRVMNIPRCSIISTQFTLEMFCSDTGEWRESVVLTPLPMNNLEWPGIVAYKGLLHWRMGTYICALDPLKDIKQCLLINTPAVKGNICLGVCRGRLRISEVNYSDPRSVTLSVWELQDYDARKWCLEHRVLLKKMVSADFELVKQLKGKSPHLRMIAFHPHDGDIMYLQLQSGIVLYNMRITSLELVNDLELQSALKGNSGILLRDVFPLVHPWWPTPVPSL